MQHLLYVRMHVMSTVSGGLIFAKKMRDQSYLTMLDPFQELYGNSVVFMVYIASLCGDIFWTASILSALGERSLIQ